MCNLDLAKNGARLQNVSCNCRDPDQTTDKMKPQDKKALIILIVFASIVTFYYFFIPSHNRRLALEEKYEGVVVKKYYRRGNALDIKTFSGELYKTTCQVADSIYNTVEIGDTVIKKSGDIYPVIKPRH